jgi:hypothetical protein
MFEKTAMGNVRHMSVIVVLLLSLAHAWFGHDLVHGHHHQDLGEASYSTAAPKAQSEHSFQVFAAVLVTSFFEWDIQQSEGVIALSESTGFSWRDPLHQDPKQIPRPPPVFFFHA